MRIFIRGDNSNGEFDVEFTDDQYDNQNFVDIQIGERPEISISKEDLFNVAEAFWNARCRRLEDDARLKASE